MQLRRVEKFFLRFDGYAIAEERVLVVRLNGEDSLDHVVAVDLWHGRIFHSEERCPLRLTPESLALCAGGGTAARIGGVREVVAV